MVTVINKFWVHIVSHSYTFVRLHVVADWSHVCLLYISFSTLHCFSSSDTREQSNVCGRRQLLICLSAYIRTFLLIFNFELISLLWFQQQSPGIGLSIFSLVFLSLVLLSESNLCDEHLCESVSLHSVHRILYVYLMDYYTVTICMRSVSKYYVFKNSVRTSKRTPHTSPLQRSTG
jgi:hypothetical protein